jgi:hypothetical protein
MQTLQAPSHSPQHVSSRHYIAEPWSVELSVRDAREQTGSRHDERMLAAHTVPADPYKVWLEQREADQRSKANDRQGPYDLSACAAPSHW